MVNAMAQEASTTQNASELADCGRMLVYLNGKTWSSGWASVAFARDVAEAMRLGIELVLAHEVPGIGGQAERSAVLFGTFFSTDQTPIQLTKAGIYAPIAIPFKGGPWRDTSMALLQAALAARPFRVRVQNIRISKRVEPDQPPAPRP